MYKTGNYEWVAGRLAETAKWLDEHKKFKDWAWEHFRRGRSSKRNPERTSSQVGGALGELASSRPREGSFRRRKHHCVPCCRWVEKDGTSKPYKCGRGGEEGGGTVVVCEAQSSGKQGKSAE